MLLLQSMTQILLLSMTQILLRARADDLRANQNLRRKLLIEGDVSVQTPFRARDCKNGVHWRSKQTSMHLIASDSNQPFRVHWTEILSLSSLWTYKLIVLASDDAGEEEDLKYFIPMQRRTRALITIASDDDGDEEDLENFFLMQRFWTNY